jgi:membrane protein DedA with SNARE-associated domain
MSFAEEPIFQWLSQYAYQPQMVYALIFAMMIASGFGFPLPEEVTIISVGILAYIGSQPHMFPPPEPGAPVVNGYEAALLTTIAVISADFLVFFIGRFGGRRLVTKKPFIYVLTGEVMEKVNQFISKHGLLATFLFRFTPGLRFPAHIILGMSSMPFWKFATVDGLAALVSVPTQILLIFHFGEPILATMQKFKFFVFGGLGLFLFYLVFKKIMQWRTTRQQLKSN